MNAEELKAIRQRLGLTQEQLAGKVGVAPNSIARQERGELGIRESLARLLRLIDAGLDAEAVAHAGASRRAASPKPTKGPGTARAKGQDRRGPRQNSVQRVRRARIRKKQD
jgi:transcriptional regulator with XRE-family HTH domain